MAFLFSRTCLRKWLLSKVDGLSPQSQARVRNVLSVTGAGKFFCTAVLVHSSSFLSFGMAHSILACTDCNYFLFMVSTLVAVQPGSLVYIGTGNLIHQVGLY